MMPTAGRPTAPPEEVVAEALRWVGTPYRHQGRKCGVGCDCLGLVLGVWQALLGPLPREPGPYRADWAEAAGEERFLQALRAYGIEREAGEPDPGDILLFRWRMGSPAKHAAILVDRNRIVHAYQGQAVVVSPFVPQWRRRVAGTFAFPARQT